MRIVFKLLLSLFLLFFIISNVKSQCLSGTYVIDKNADKYKSIGEALDSLTARGICGNVTFRIAPGIYREQVIFPKINGAGIDKRITFTSLTGLVYDVILEYPSSSSDVNNYVLAFNEGSFYTLNKLTINRTGSQLYSQVILLGNNSSNNKFSNNQISNELVNSNERSSLVYSDVSLDTANTFSGNTFTKGSYGIFLYGETGFESSNVIEKNTFEGQGTAGIYMSYQDSPEIKGNIWKNSSQSTGYSCISLSNCKGKINITGNEIKNLGYNEIRGSGFKLFNCIGSDNALIANNIIVVYGNSGSGALYLRNSSGIKVINNTLSSGNITIYLENANQIKLLNNIIKSDGYCLILESNSSLSQSDYNAFYSSGGISRGGTFNHTTLDSWRKGTNHDAHSKSVYPSFYSKTNLRIFNDVDLYNAGLYDPQINIDIDGDLRSNPPDIGADEFELYPNSASIYKVISPILSVCQGPNTLKLVIRNQGSSDLTKLTIDCIKNKQVFNSYNWSGNLKTGEKDTVKIEAVNFKKDSVYEIQFKIKQPNEVSDPYVLDDSTIATNIYTKMEGIYRIGGLKPDYANFTAAINDLTLRGVCGPVIFKVRNQLYKEKLKITKIAGVSKINTIVFEPESSTPDVSIVYEMPSSSYDPIGYVVAMENVSFVTFKNVKFTSLTFVTNASAPIVNLYQCKNIKFINNHFEGKFSTIFSDGKYCDSIFIENNIFDKGTKVIGFRDYGKLLVIKGNTFRDMTERAIEIITASSVKIINNTFISNTTSDAVYLSRLTDTGFVQSNIFQLPKSYTGLTMYYCSGIGYITNNYINLTTGIGIELSNSPGKKIYHNTIKVNSDGPNHYALRVYSSSFGEIKNNILINNGKGRAFSFFGSGFESDYNAFYSGGVNLVNDYTSLTSYISKERRDSNSVYYIQDFISSDDFHLSKSSSLIDKGVFIKEVIKDLDGEPRLNSPDIGADEANSVHKDVAIISLNKGKQNCNDHPRVVAELKNMSSDTLYSYTIQWEVDDELQKPFAGKENIAPGESKQVVLGEFLFKYYKPYKLKAWVNSSSDSEPLNDTITIPSFASAMGGVYTVGGDNPDFKSIHDAVEALAAMGVCSPVKILLRDGIYDELLYSKEYNKYTISIPEIPGASALNTILIESESQDTSKVKIICTSRAGTILCNGVDYITFSHLSIINDYDPNLPYTINIQSGSDHVSFRNNRISNGIAAMSGMIKALLVEGNYITSKGIDLVANENVYIRGCVIRDNFFKGIDNYGVHAIYNENLLIENNIFETGNLFSPTYYFRHGVMLDRCKGDIQIKNNQFRFIKDLNGTPSYGLYIIGCNGTQSKPILVANNFLLLNPPNKHLTDFYIGIYSVQSSYISYIHNTVFNNKLESYATNTQTSCVFAYGKEVKFLNNIFVNYNPGYCYEWIGKEDVESDYNLFYNKDYEIVKEYSDFNKWQSKGMDQHSIVGEPKFAFQSVSSSNQTDLHLDPSVSNPYRSALYIPELDKDIDGDSRNLLRPLFGADEYIPVITNGNTNLASARITEVVTDKNLCTGLKRLVAKLLNTSNDTINHAIIQLVINDTLTAEKTWNGLVLPNDYMGVELGTFNFPNGGAYEVDASLKEVNHNLYTDTQKYKHTFDIVINSVPAFTYFSEGKGGKINFLNNSTGANVYEWDFGDGKTSSEAAPQHTYDVKGIYVVKLTATGSCTSNTFTDTVYVDKNPDLNPVSISYTSNCLVGRNLGVVVQNLSPETIGFFIINWSIDGILQAPISNNSSIIGPLGATIIPLNTDNITKSSHVFKIWTSSPNFQLDGNITNDTLERIVYTQFSPQADFTYSHIGNNAISFNNTSTGSTYYSWDFGDNTSSSTANPIHTFSGQQVTYIVKLIASNSCGTSMVSKEISIVPNDIIDEIHSKGVLYPIPSNGVVYYNNEEAINTKVEISITTSYGERVQTESLVLTGKPLMFDLSNQPSGIYFLHVRMKEKNMTYKIVKY
ncbi:CARDB domain-containing protein [Sporocytophaga myxococcoides]|uniref:CARDB domain-containing protein n=1 Tax=Sporocytophaga myxococcoides TaxID=153721 RepID=A0A098LHF2_9BACT|nr:right-handed parallel beta-helix repeat-containing protein [Sporocytophaga myxococcoides]GAL85588.1 CARDB domain-containing protein [Sporocytophaga myxococcoides]